MRISCAFAWTKNTSKSVYDPRGMESLPKSCYKCKYFLCLFPVLSSEQFAPKVVMSRLKFALTIIRIAPRETLRPSPYGSTGAFNHSFSLSFALCVVPCQLSRFTWKPIIYDRYWEETTTPKCAWSSFQDSPAFGVKESPGIPHCTYLRRKWRLICRAD